MTYRPYRILVMAQVEPNSNPRPRRIIELFRGNGHIVHVASFKAEGDLQFDAHYEIKRPSLRIRYKIMRKLVGMAGLIIPIEGIQKLLSDLRWGFKSLGKQLAGQNFDLIVVEDIYLLPFAFEIKRNAKVIMDAREFYPEELGHSLFWSATEKPMRVRICKKYLKRCDAVMTVSQGLADRYENDFGVKPFLLRSMPNFQDISPSPMEDGRIRIVHHGVANRDRRLENLIDIMYRLDERFELDIYLTGTTAYVEELRDLAKDHPKINFLKPVPFQDIIPMLNRYDMGFCYLEPTTFNLEHCLPNKFFEFIQGRLALIIGPSAHMVPLIEEYKCGFITPAFDTEKAAAYLNSLTTSDITAAKAASHWAAPILCYENESQKVLNIVNDLLGLEPAPIRQIS